MDTSKLNADQKALLAGLEKRAAQNLDRGLTAKALQQQSSYLQDCEQQLINLMSIPQLPPLADGNIEFGLVLYGIQKYLPTWISGLFPAPKIRDAMLQQWNDQLQKDGPVAMDDGTLVGYDLWEVMDRGWLFPFVLRLLQTSIGEKVYLQVPIHPFGSNPYSATIQQDSLKIALMGDWGTGIWNDNNTQGPAAQILKQIQVIAPDILVHLGDVYYSGTSINLPFGVNAFMLFVASTLNDSSGWKGWNKVVYDINEENDRLVMSWSSPAPKQSLTLNSNHEMYSGANGYFPALTAAPFAQQNATSYFMLIFQDWVILGLDSAYFSPDFLYMNGRLQSAANQSQVTWIQGLVSSGKLKNKKVIVLTHHNGLTFDGFPVPGYKPLESDKPQPNLYDDLSGALGRDPDYWYWGHIHNGIVYTKNISLSPSKQTATLCRCLGHGALPFGSAYHWLKNQSGKEEKYPLGKMLTGPNPNIAYYAQTLLQNPPPPAPPLNRVKNGFAVLTLKAGSIKEEVYEQGTSTPVWTSGA
ncbi:MAG: metallophosphoesterase [Candidatus Sulfotelmatobacter sp.]